MDEGLGLRVSGGLELTGRTTGAQVAQGPTSECKNHKAKANRKIKKSITSRRAPPIP